MKIQEIRSNSCALVWPLPPVSSLAWHARPISPADAKRGYAETRNDAYQIVPRITHVDRVIIRGYFHQRWHAIKNLLPGLQHLVRNDRLPSRLRRTSLPGELECRLSVLPAGHERVLVGSDVALIETATLSIVDIFRDVRATIA